MGYMRFNYRSQALGRYVDISIVYPTDNYSYYDQTVDYENAPEESRRFIRIHPVYEEGMKFQTVYLIHGGGDDDTHAMRYINVERYAQDNDVMVVCPNIANSFGVDTMYGVKYQTFLAEELPKLMQTVFAASAKREDNFIVGYAMGGNVALGTALMHPEKYAMCVDISGGIGMTLDNQTLKDELNGDHFRNVMPLFNATFGEADTIDDSRFDLYKIARENKEKGVELPKYIIACGSKEFIRERVEGDVAKLRELDYDMEYIVAEGYNHDFEMWDTYFRKTVEEYLPLKRNNKR